MSEVLSMSAPQTCEATHSATGSQELESGRTASGAQASATISESGRRVYRANRSRPQASKKDLKMSDIFGPFSNDWSPSQKLTFAMANRLQAKLSTLGSTLYQLTWKPWALPSGRLLIRQRASVRRTSATEPTGLPPNPAHWPTPRVGGSPEGYGNADRPGGPRGRLEDTVPLTGWPTPAAQEFEPKDLERLQERRAALQEKQGTTALG